MKHSKLPWTYRDLTKGEKALTPDDRFKIECDSNIPGIKAVVAKCSYRFNAEIIVKAVNNHERLVEACDLAFGLITKRDSHERVDIKEVVKTLKAALEAVK